MFRGRVSFSTTPQSIGDTNGFQHYPVIALHVVDLEAGWGLSLYLPFIVFIVAYVRKKK